MQPDSLQASIALFGVCWIAILGGTYLLVRPFFGLTLFFAAMTALYILLPLVFYPSDFDLFPTLLAACVLGVFGFWLALTATSRLSEARLHRAYAGSVDTRRAVLSAVLLGGVSAVVLLVANPDVLEDVKHYETRILFQGEQGPLAFLLNQVVMALAVLTMVVVLKGRFVSAVALSAAAVGWALYSNHKLSLLTTLAVWFAWWLQKVWERRVSRRMAWAALLLLPGILLVLISYAVFRGGDARDLAEAVELIGFNLTRLGEGGVGVGDFDGPYRVLVSHLTDRRAPLYGLTYLSQLPVLLPRAWRGRFSDLSESFAMEAYGVAYKPGFGFAFSPWAEGYANFGTPGFLVQGVLFGLLTRLLILLCQRSVGYNTLTLSFVVFSTALFERSYLVAEIKNIVVYILPFLCTWTIAGVLSHPWHRKERQATSVPLEQRGT